MQVTTLLHQVLWTADLVIFDPEMIAVKGTFTQPHAYPTGIDHVMVNGKMAIQNGSFLDRLHGKVLRKN